MKNSRRFLKTELIIKIKRTVKGFVNEIFNT